MQSRNNCMFAIYPNVILHIICPLKAVSYTHLRAHETLRYLVCRLLLEKMESHISCIFVISSIVCFHMCSQIACLKRCKVAIVACVSFSQMWIFTCATNRLLEQMKSHNSCRCANFFHYDFQIAFLNRCKVTLVACWSFSQMWVFTCDFKWPA